VPRAGKRRPAMTDCQLVFSFAAPRPAAHPGDLAGLGRLIASGVARALKEDPRAREEIAGRMAALLGEDVSPHMLNAYASEARADHNISCERFLALIAATERFDILDAVLARVGARALVGEEVQAARLGHLLAKKAELDGEIRALRAAVTPIGRGGLRA
jgi:hypothetical protein